nr:MAG TPA_asm: Queuosine biosynthesis protein QueC [Caudoviricetes sp.]
MVILSALKKLPRLFRGVTPDRHAGEAFLAVVLAWLAHSGYPLDLDMSCKESPDRCGTCAICRTAIKVVERCNE